MLSQSAAVFFASKPLFMAEGKVAKLARMKAEQEAAEGRAPEHAAASLSSSARAIKATALRDLPSEEELSLTHSSSDSDETDSKKSKVRVAVLFKETHAWDSCGFGTCYLRFMESCVGRCSLLVRLQKYT